jgi:predicted ATPase
MLLVLDNFERVVEASQLMIELLDACRSLKVLITSRRKLGIRMEREFRVPPLSAPNEKQLAQSEKELVGKLSNNEAINLFIERARDDVPDFDITRNNARDIAEICIQLGGLPLAIELAAARIKMHTPYEIKLQLRDRIKLLKLSIDAPDREPRHRSIEAAIDWSYDLLNDTNQAMFRRMSVFTGGWTLKAAEALNTPTNIILNLEEHDITETERSLLSLIDNNLVLTALREDVAPERRFNMLETIREYGLERLKSSCEEDEIRRRHAQFFLDLAEEAEPKLNSADRNLWMERLEVEYDNIRTSLHWMIHHGEAVLGLRMGGALWRFWYIRSYFKEGREWLTKLLALPSGSAAKGVRANVLNGAGNLAYNQGDYSAAESFHRECLEIRRELGNEQAIAGSLNNLGLVVRYRGAYEQASEYYEEALRINRRLGNRTWEALNLDNWGNVAYDQGDNERTRELYEASLSIFGQLQDSWGMAMVECDLANVLRDLKNLDAAQKLYEESLARQSSVGDRKVTAAACIGLGHIASEQGYFTTAHTRFEEGLKISHDIDDQQSIINALEGFAALAANQAQPERAFCLAGAAAALRHNLGIKLAPAGRQRLNNWLILAKHALSEEDIARARRMGWRFTMEQAIAYAMEQAKPFL